MTVYKMQICCINNTKNVKKNKLFLEWPYIL